MKKKQMAMAKMNYCIMNSILTLSTSWGVPDSDLKQAIWSLFKNAIWELKLC